MRWKFLALWAIVSILCGVIFVIGGVGGIIFTYNSVAEENIVTPEDASIANTPVRGPMTLKAQADIIREHTLKTTGGKTFAEMPRQIPKLDSNGNQIIGEDGKPVMVANTARDLWITATTLRTALQMGILAYAFSAFVLIIGILGVYNGLLIYTFSKKS